MTTGWRGLQYLVAKDAEQQDPFLDNASASVDVVFVGEPLGTAISPDGTVSLPDNTVNLHVLHNVFVPAVGTVKIMGGGYDFFRQLLNYQYTLGTKDHVFGVTRDSARIVLEKRDRLHPDVRRLIDLAPTYELSEWTAAYAERL